MKAAITTTYGPANVLETRELPTPSFGADEVLVQIRATPVTAGDRRLRAADFPGFSAVVGRLMFGLFSPRKGVQGTMFAGRVVAVGANVTDYAVGDDVFGSVDDGTYAQFVAVPQDGRMAKIPRGISFEDAAEVPYGAGTALYFLRDLGAVKPGEKVLVLGASGGVGRYAVQLACHMGAEVTGVCSARNAALVRELGASHVIDYGSEDFTTNGQRYDVIFDIADATTFARCRNSLTATGRYLTLFMTFRAIFRMLTTRLTAGPKAVAGVALGTRAHTEELGELLAAGVLRPVVAERFSLDHIVEAHARADAGDAQGGVLVTMAAA